MDLLYLSKKTQHKQHQTQTTNEIPAPPTSPQSSQNKLFSHLQKLNSFLECDWVY